MKESNYEITKKKMAQQFLKYDQNEMIAKYHLASDESYLYIEFVGARYRVSREDGIVWRIESEMDGGHGAEGAGSLDAHEDGTAFAEEMFLCEAGYNEAMSIYDVLCYARSDCHTSGHFCPIGSLEGIVLTRLAKPGDDTFRADSDYFDTRTSLLHEACRRLGGVAEGRGDVAYRIPVFSFLPLRFQFWQSDEDFPAKIDFLWDSNILQYMHYETVWFVMTHVMQRLREMVEEMETSALPA
jgi:hypothetical protein